MSLRLGDLGGGQTRTWARPAGRRSPREKTGEAYDPSQILGERASFMCDNTAASDACTRMGLYLLYNTNFTVVATWGG